MNRFLPTPERPFYDVWTILDRSPRFQSYEKNRSGFIKFWQHHLLSNNVALSPEGVRVFAGLWTEYPVLEFLRLTLLPFYHCGWEPEMRRLYVELEGSTVTAPLTEFTTALFQVGITWEQVPEDWRDDAMKLVTDKGLTLTQFASVAELEHFVDREYGFGEASDDEESEQEELRIRDGPEETPMNEEDRQELARTLRLDPDSFVYKSQAMALYEKRSH